MMDQFMDNWWQQYLEAFSYFSRDNIRPGCQPRVFLHANPAAESIVLVHGLSDSTYYMLSLARHFHEVLGFNVYLPLLQCHGLKNPRGMEDVSLDEWKANVTFAIAQAASASARVSVGGFSTGGTLSYLMALENKQINGDLFLFSAALGLTSVGGVLLGDLKESALRTKLLGMPLTDLVESAGEIGRKIGQQFGLDANTGVPLIGKNPYKYAYIDLDGARQLALLIKITDELTARYSAEHRIGKRVFIVHSESDKTADIEAVKHLSTLCEDLSPVTPYYIKAKLKVGHAGLVLSESIQPADSPQEANAASFAEILCRIDKFVGVTMS